MSQRTIYRLPGISRIRSTALRRLALLATFPLLFVLNVAVCAASLTVFVATHALKNNRELCASFVLRWHTPEVTDKEAAK